MKQQVDEWVKQGNRRPCLIAILVGEDPASEKYVSNKMIAAKEVGKLFFLIFLSFSINNVYLGIDSKTIRLPHTTEQDEILREIQRLNEDSSVDGILVQLPVPEHVCERTVCNAVHPLKDVDGFHTTNIGKLTLNSDTFVPATALGVYELIKRWLTNIHECKFVIMCVHSRYNIPTFGKNVVVCGRSKNVGLPIVLLLHSDARNELPGCEATVTLCHRHTPPEQLEIFAKQADIIVTATG